MFLNSIFMGALFVGVWLLLALPAGAYLIMSYQKTRMNAFLWLAFSVIVWPTVARLLTVATSILGPSMMVRRAWTMSQYGAALTIVTLSETLIGGALLIVSCVLLYQQVSRPATVAAPRP